MLPLAYSAGNLKISKIQIDAWFYFQQQMQRNS